MEFNNQELAIIINALYSAQVPGREARMVANLLDRCLEVAKERGIVREQPAIAPQQMQAQPNQQEIN